MAAVDTAAAAAAATAKSEAIAAANAYTDGKIGEVNTANNNLGTRVEKVEAKLGDVADGTKVTTLIATAKSEAIAEVVGTAESASSTDTIKGAKKYTDEKIAELLDNDTEAVDSIMELAQAMTDNKDAIDALRDIAGSKASQADHDALAGRVGANETAISGLQTTVSDMDTAYKAADETTLQSAKDYADGLAGNYATAEQGAKADSALQEITTTADGGLKVTNKNQIDIDTGVTFVLKCGDSVIA